MARPKVSPDPTPVEGQRAGALDLGAISCEDDLRHVLSGSTRERAVPNRWRLSLASVLAISCLSGRVRAGNDEGILVGTQAAQTAAAVTATVSDGASVWYNPAGLANTTASSLDASLTSYTARFIHVDDLLEGADNSTGATYTDWVVVPSLVSHVLKVSRRWRFSYAVVVPRARTTASVSPCARPMARAGRFCRKSTAKSSTSGLAWVGICCRTCALGFPYSVSTTRTTCSRRPSQATQTIPIAPSRLSLCETPAIWDSARAPVCSGMWSAISRSASPVIAPTMVVVRSSKDTGSVFTPASETGDSALQQFDRSKDTQATFHANGTPQLRMGGAYYYAHGHVALDSTLNFPMSVPYSEIDRKFSWNLRAGFQHRLGDTFLLGAGFFTDRNPAKRVGVDFYGLTMSFFR